jgi:hypothetical protein
MSAEDRELIVHRQWLGLLQPVGLVVSPPALIECGAVPEKNAVKLQERLHEVVERAVKRGEAPSAFVPDLMRLLEHVLDWRRVDLLGPDCAEPLPDALDVPLPDYGETLRATYAARDPVTPGKLVLLLHVVPRGTKLDEPPPEESKTGWHASPYAKFERLLRKIAVHTGLLTNGEQIRLVHAPEHQTSGHLTFPVQAMTEVTGRPILAAFKMLLGAPTVFDLPDGKRLADILEKSRKYQNQVSNDLAEQVLGALWELLQGFQKADTKAEGKLIVAETAEDREHVYGGLLTALMRMVFLLYAEDQGLLPNDRIWVDNYSVAGLWTRLRDDAALHPDTMDDRYGAWATLLALFRIVHHGGGHGAVKLPARRGQLFDPDAYPFLEGRSRGSVHDRSARIEAPRVSDGCIYRVLSGLLVLDGERLSYRALDVEQIGSVYEAMMGYEVERIPGRSLAVRFSRKGIPGFLFFDADALLAQPAKDRVEWLAASTTCELTGTAATSLHDATTPDAVLAALDRRASKRTPRVLSQGSLVLQPGEERRRSGSHYTPRELTKPIVETTLRPVLDALGSKPTPQQILELKVCDPAMGSGAFLVEACRQLAERLVEAWDHHKQMPDIPADEDALLHAKRLIAQRCLYGVDKNPFAVNLAKLSIWLVTLAREHAFTFVDHALKHGDSLVGLTKDQIIRLHWDVGSGKPTPLPEQSLRLDTAAARVRRTEIGELGDVDERAKCMKLAEADASLADARLVGDLVIAAYFAANKSSARSERLRELRFALDRLLEGKGDRAALVAATAALRRGQSAIPPFHWPIEFPEVFDRPDGGFDAFIGNPPFLGGPQLSQAFGSASYQEWLKQSHARAFGNSDLSAYFFRRAFSMTRRPGYLGMLATKSIAEGSTRTTGLQAILADGGVIFEATRSLRWPGEASVLVAVVHIATAQSAPVSGARLDGHAVSTINSRLLPAPEVPDPVALGSNALFAFIGADIRSSGFILDATEHSALARDERNSEYLMPFLGGEEVNTSPSMSNERFAINFGTVQLTVAEDYPALLSVVRDRVKPGRDRAKDHGPGKQGKKFWWQYVLRADPLYAAIDGLDRCLVTAISSSHLSFSFQPIRQVFAHSLAVFAFDTYGPFACLQSRVHYGWANLLSSRFWVALRYSVSDAFQTFPFPREFRTAPGLESVGREYYEFRSDLMLRNNEGLTKTYNRFHDPDDSSHGIDELRRLHDAMDRAVLDAYGWTDIRPKCMFYLDYEIDEEEWGARKRPYRYGWPVHTRDEVLGRLLELNRMRAEEERLKGVAADAGALLPEKVRRLSKAKRVAELPADGLPLSLDDGVER